ncbi:sensor histidine kinase [Streptomyces sp. VB1]|uniref:sensor histidine kinase n=1 Tax=Streptomyces sp. VB1 TaxID=2986803 RepID=UPI0022428028|nr:sensor histidine kinase [Streptomyces sp. VB1]UZI28654.1 sensor histidine kinase [Streptomyces sp. VB1]
MRLPRTLPRSLAGQLFAMQVVLIAAVVAGCAVFAYASGSAQAEETAARQVRVAALAVADSPSVREAIRTPDPSAALQPYAERVREDTGIAFITIMDTERVRWTHPDTEQIGDTFLGNTAKALRGQTFTETYTGTLGPSIRVVTPIRDNGRIVGLVSAGITVDRVSSQVRDQLGALALAAGGALALGGMGTYVVNARLRRHTHGMNAAELSRLHDYHQATLHAVREGLLMLDGRRRIALINDAGRELLGLEPDAEAVGRTVDELALPAPLTGALLASEARVDELHLTAERVVVVNTRPVVGGERRGTVVTLRDHTELQALTGELDSERGFTQALRSQAHEAANRLHTVVSLIELGRVAEAVEFATAELELAQVLTDRVVGAVEEPVLAALLLGKAAQANERGVELVLAEDSLIDDGALPPSLAQRDLVTILGNLIDNAVEAASEGADGGSGHGPAPVPAPRAPGGPAGRARVTVTALADERELLLRVTDTGSGIGPEAADEVFRRGWSTHGAGRGLGLALVRQAACRNGGTVRLDAGPDGGARFTVRLPLPARPPTGSRPTPAPGSGSTPGSGSAPVSGSTPGSAHKEVTA